MKSKFHDSYTERKLTWHNIEPEIYDEEFLQVHTLFGIFKKTRRFTLHNDMKNTNGKEIKGFKK